MSALVFVDTNVFVYSRDTRNASKQRRAHEWMEFLWDTRRGRLSPQVLHEYYETVTRKLRPGLTPEEARADVRALFHWLAPIDAPLLLEAAWHLQAKGSLSFWDALILGAAQTMDCGFVLSEDMSAGQEIEGMRVVNPFRTSPKDLDRH
jgi:predicted nucleic acid-binding protein